METKIIKRIKCKVQSTQVIVKVKLLPEFVINVNQYELLSKKYGYGFLKIDSIRKNKLVFTGHKGISLLERLKKPLSEYDFFFIIEQIVDTVQRIEKIGLSCNNLIQDVKFIFFSETTKELSFVYLPVATPHRSDSIMVLIEQIIYETNLSGTNQNFLSEFSCFIKKLQRFDTDRIEEYICRIDSNIVSLIKKGSVKENSSPNKQTVNRNVREQFSILEDEKTDIMADDEPTDLMQDDELTDIISDNLQGSLFAEEQNGNDESTCISEDDATEIFYEDKTDLFNEAQVTSCKFPTLTRILTEEVIRIDKPVFRIGKEENCVDYVVTNNIAISRSHADIISRGSRYFVFDLRSKNKSYINSRVLPAEHEVEIFNGDVLKLANEEFLFQG